MYLLHTYCILFLLKPHDMGNKYLNFIYDVSLLSFHYVCTTCYDSNDSNKIYHINNHTSI